jgi:hypothetical protein
VRQTDGFLGSHKVLLNVQSMQSLNSQLCRFDKNEGTSRRAKTNMSTDYINYMNCKIT